MCIVLYFVLTLNCALGLSQRYTPQNGGERTVTVGAGGLTVQYQNDRTETQWLDGDNYSVNHFDSKNQ